MPQKVFTAKNGAKYIKLANGRCRFVKGPPKRKGGKKKGGGLSSDAHKAKKTVMKYANKASKYIMS